jgi:mono/diheme cytochrome c family protein
MKLLFILISGLVLTIGFQNCAPSHTVGTQLGSTTGSADLVNSANSVAIFETTLFPILRQNCASCHGGGIPPLHSVVDPQSAHDTLINSALVNLASPSASRVVIKINGGHQSLPVALAVDLQTAIQAWATDLANSSASLGGTIALPSAPVLKAEFKSIHNLILVPKCTGCHGSAVKKDGIDYSTYDKTIATGKVIKGNANSSGLYNSCVDGNMPEGAPALTTTELAAIRDWINAGAINN